MRAKRASCSVAGTRRIWARNRRSSIANVFLLSPYARYAIEFNSRLQSVHNLNRSSRSTTQSIQTQTDPPQDLPIQNIRPPSPTESVSSLQEVFNQLSDEILNYLPENPHRPSVEDLLQDFSDDDNQSDTSTVHLRRPPPSPIGAQIVHLPPDLPYPDLAAYDFLSLILSAEE